MRKLQLERTQLRERAEALQVEIFKGGERMDQFKLLMNWNQEEFEQWALASRQKEEDNAALARYQKQDDARVRELAMQLEKVWFGGRKRGWESIPGVLCIKKVGLGRGGGRGVSNIARCGYIALAPLLGEALPRNRASKRWPCSRKRWMVRGMPLAMHHRTAQQMSAAASALSQAN